MTALTPATDRLRWARSRAGHIRYGMGVMDETIEHIARARAEADHLTLGYKTWQEYVDGEFGPERLKLAPEKRRQYVEMLALAGASQREIGHTLGLSASMVNRTVNSGSVSNETDESTTYPDSPARSPLVEAMTGAIEDADERTKTAAADRVGSAAAPNHPGSSSPGEAEPVRGVATEPGTAAGAGASDPAPAPDPGVAAPVDVSGSDPATGPDTRNPDANTSGVRGPSLVNPPTGEGEHGGSVTSPADPPCEKCGGELEPGAYDEDFRQCVGCDPNGAHVADGSGPCLLCANLDALIESVPAAYVPLQIVAGDDGLYLRCGHCAAVVAPLKPDTPLAVALIEADQHAENCQGSTT